MTGAGVSVAIRTGTNVGAGTSSRVGFGSAASLRHQYQKVQVGI